MVCAVDPVWHGSASTARARAWSIDVTLADGWRPDVGHGIEYVRYSLTDLLDDLAHAGDAGERTVVAAAVWTAVAQHTLAFAGHWTGHGKWLLRELRDLDPDFARRCLDACGDVPATAALGRQLLDGHGGAFFAGHLVFGERP
jgi:hypothetical protein